MTPQEAYNYIESVMNQCVKAGMFKDIADVVTVNESLTIIKKEMEEANTLREEKKGK